MLHFSVFTLFVFLFWIRTLDVTGTESVYTKALVQIGGVQDNEWSEAVDFEDVLQIKGRVFIFEYLAELFGIFRRAQQESGHSAFRDLCSRNTAHSIERQMERNGRIKGDYGGTISQCLRQSQ